MRTERLFFVLAAFVFAACGAKDEGISDAAVLTDGAAADAGPATLSVTFESALPGLVLPRAGFVRGEGGELFSMRERVISRSLDRGRTWEDRGSVDAFNLAFGGGTLFAGGGSGVWRSDDGAATFNEITLPYTPTEAGAWDVATSDGSLWLYRTLTSRLFCSTNEGASFDEMTMPVGATRLDFQSTRGGELLAIFDGTTVVRAAGCAAWETIGTYMQAMTAYETASGTLFLSVRDDTSYAELRSTDDGVTWERREAPGMYTYFEKNDGSLLRVSGSALVDDSTDDGATWTPRVTMYPEYSVLEVIAFEEELVGASLGSLARLAHDATQWTFDEEAGLPHAAVGRYRDIAFSETGRVALVGEGGVFVSDDEGVTFRRGFDTSDSTEVGTLTCVGIRPDGERIFVGSANGRFAILEGDGETRVLESSIPGRLGEAIHQARWLPNPGEPVLYVTTGNEDNTSGMVFQSQPQDDTVRWSDINPLVIRSAPNSIIGASYWGFEVMRLDSTDIIALAGILRWTSTNYSAPYIYENLDFPNTDTWRDIERPVAFGQPLTISASGEYGEPVAYLYPNDRLFVGSFSNFVAEVQATDLIGDLLSAKFAPDGKLWVVTSSGLYRSTTSLR